MKKEENELEKMLLSMSQEELRDLYNDICEVEAALELDETEEKVVEEEKGFFYSHAAPMLEDIRKLDRKKQFEVCKAFERYINKSEMTGFFIERFLETVMDADPDNEDEGFEYIHYAINDMDNAITEIDYCAPMVFFEIEKKLRKVIQ